MRSTETPSQAFFNNHENTMGRKVCSSTFSALMILEKNHTMPKDLGSQNALEKNLSAFIKDLITHGFLPENKEEVIDSAEAEIEVGADSGTESEDTTYVDSEDEAEIKKTPAQQFQESVLAKALEPINAHDRGVVYNPETKKYEPVEFSLCKTLTILLVALRDKQGETRGYWKSPYLIRLKKFYSILNPQVKCHTGFRNDWVKNLLHEEYDNMYFMEELGQTLENLASTFFKEQLLKIETVDPKRFYKILFQWLDVRKYDRPDFEAFIDSLTTELQAFLERALLSMGLDPNDKKLDTGKDWEKSISDSLKLRIDSAQSLACPHLPGFEKAKQMLSEFIEKEKSLPPVLLEKFRSCETVKDLEDRALDVHRDFIYLRERAQRYNFAFPLGKEGGELVAYVRVLIPSLDKLNENPETAWGNYRETLKTCESQLEHFIENNRKANNHFEYFRNSFALAKNMKSPEDIYQLYHHVKTLFEDHCLRVTDEMIDKWFENSKQSPGFFDLQQHDLNRICWQALFLSPLNWSEKFTRNLFEGILHQLENPINPDSLHDNILKSFPEALVKQLKHRLSLRKIPLMISKAEHFFPGNLDGITLIQNPHELIEKLQDPTCDRVALIEHLHFPAYFFKPNMQAKDGGLEKVLALLTKEKAPVLLPRLLNFGDSELLVSLESFLRVLETVFPEEERWPFIQKSLENPDSKTKAHFLLNPRLRVMFYRDSFNKFLSLISRVHRIHLLKKLIQIGAEFAGNPLKLDLLREILCQLPEKDWPEFFAVLPHPNRLDDFAPSFIDFLPEHLLPNFFKWYMTDNLSPTWDIATIFNQSRDGKCLPILKAIFELDEKILEKIVSYCIKDFFDVLPRLESKDRAEYLHLLALTLSKLNEIPPSNFECLSKLSEEETIEFIGFFKDPSALQLLTSLPKSCWASFCEQIGFTEKVARNDLSDFWPYLRKFEDKKAVVDFFKIDIAKNLQSPENFIFATAHTPVSDMDKIPKLSNQGGKWIDIFDSYDKLYEIFSGVFRLDEDLNHLERELVSCEESEEGHFRLLSSCVNPSALPDGLTRAKSRCHDLLAHLSPDLKQVIKNKDQLLGIVVVISSSGPHLDRFIKAWEDHFKNPMPDALSKGLSSFFEKHLDFLDNIFSSFEDYQNFFSELQQLNLSKEALFNFLRAPFLKKSRDPEQYEKMFASFQEVDGNIGRDCYLNSLIPWPELDSENFLLTIYPYFNENTWPEGLFRILVKNCDILDMAILARQYFMLWENIGFNPSQVEMHWLRLCDWLEVREILHLFRVICAQDPKKKFNLSEEQKLNLFKAIVNTEKFKRDEGLQQRNLFAILLATSGDDFFFTVYRVLGHYQFYEPADLDSQKISEECLEFWKGRGFSETKDHFLKVCSLLKQKSLSLFAAYFEPLGEEDKKELLKEMLSSEEFQWPGYRNDIFPIIARTKDFYASNALIKFMAHELSYFNWSLFNLSANDVLSLFWTHEGVPIWREVFTSQASHESFTAYFRNDEILKSIFSRLDLTDTVALLNQIDISTLLQNYCCECFEIIKDLPFSLGKQAGVLIPSFAALLALLTQLKNNHCEIGPIFVNLARQEEFSQLKPETADQVKLLELFNFDLVYLDRFREKKPFDSIVHAEFFRIVNQPELVLGDRIEFTLKLIARHIENIQEFNTFLEDCFSLPTSTYETIFSELPRYKLVKFVNFVRPDTKHDMIGTIWVDKINNWSLGNNSENMRNQLAQFSKIGAVIYYYAKRLEDIFSKGETHSECYGRPTLFEVIIGFFETQKNREIPSLLFKAELGISENAKFIIEGIRVIERKFPKDPLSHTEIIDKAVLTFLGDQLIKIEEEEGYDADLPRRLHFAIFFLSCEPLRMKTSNCYYCEEELTPQVDPIQNSNNGP